MGCMQNALAIRNIDSSVQVSLSDAIGALAQQMRWFIFTTSN